MPEGLRKTTQGHNTDKRSPNRDTNTTEFVQWRRTPSWWTAKCGAYSDSTLQF